MLPTRLHCHRKVSILLSLYTLVSVGLFIVRPNLFRGGQLETITYASYEGEPLSNPSDNHYSPVYVSPNDPVLGLLYPQGFGPGGYRNQVIRFLGLVTHAIYAGYPFILVDSLQFETFIDGQRTPIPYDMLFDVGFWNAYRQEGNITTYEGIKVEDVVSSLPTLVGYHTSSNYNCWYKEEKNKTANTDYELAANGEEIQGGQTVLHNAISRGFFLPIYDRAVAVATGKDTSNFRALDLLEESSTCQGRPTPYGGGGTGGRLWKSYMRVVGNMKQHTYGYPYGLDSALKKAFRPKKEWRDLAMSCIPSENYLSIHVRMEMDMIAHKCGESMPKILTLLFSQVEDLLSHPPSSWDEGEQFNIEYVSLALNREQMEYRRGKGYQTYKVLAEENLAVLNRYNQDRRVKKIDDVIDVGLESTHTLKGRPVIECGSSHVQRYYTENPDSLRFGTILDSIVDFHILVNSKVFIGVRNSSFSADVWAVRYSLGKGSTNYEYTTDGIKHIGEDGKPPLHYNC